MFDKSRNKGHVQLCMKRYDGRTKPHPRTDGGGKGKSTVATAKSLKTQKESSSQDQHKNRFESTSQENNGEYMCLIRAVLKSEKISTIVHAKDVNKFQMAYCNLLKSNIDGLKRQKKLKTKKTLQ